MRLPGLLLMCCLFGCAQAATAQSFEVATVKPAPGADPSTGSWSLPDKGSFNASHVPLTIIRHVRNLSLSHIAIAPLAADARPAILLQEVNRVDLFAITAPRPSIQLRQVTDLRLQWSRAAADIRLAEADSRLLT